MSLTVDDGNGHTATDSVTINVNDVAEPPVGIEGEGGSGSCTDNIDNDGDGRTDLADVDCKWSSELVSSQRGLCSDNKDNDGDGLKDSKDEDCFHASVRLQAQ